MQQQPLGGLAQLVERTLSMCKVMSSTLIASKILPLHRGSLQLLARRFFHHSAWLLSISSHLFLQGVATDDERPASVAAVAMFCPHHRAVESREPRHSFAEMLTHESGPLYYFSFPLIYPTTSRLSTLHTMTTSPSPISKEALVELDGYDFLLPDSVRRPAFPARCIVTHLAPSILGLISPTTHQPDYEASLQRWFSSSIRPAGVVFFPRSVEDAAFATRWATKHGVELVVRGGGHSVSGVGTICAVCLNAVSERTLSRALAGVEH
jgi:hypothetical protein